MIITALDGFFMALADSVPGVSGGTIAFILGFYDNFIDALHSLFGKDSAAKKRAFVYLLKLGVGWGIGMAACVFLLADLFAKNIYFMSSVFLGLTAASIPFVARAERASLKGGFGNAVFALIGAAAVVLLSLLRSGGGILGTIDFLNLQPLHYVYVFLSGMVAITAMVLPGISGSTVLLIAGVYLPAINAIKEFLCLNFAEIPGLLALGTGILCGVGVSVRFIRGALKKHRGKMVWLILGLMLGSLYAIIMGPTTLSEPVPALSAATFSPLGFALGLAVLFGLELIKKFMTAKQDTKTASKEAFSDET